MPNGMQIAVRLSAEQLGLVDRLVKDGRFASRAEAIRAGLDALIAEARDLDIAEEYRQAYAGGADDGGLAEAGAVFAAEAAAAEKRTGT